MAQRETFTTLGELIKAAGKLDAFKAVPVKDPTPPPLPPEALCDGAVYDSIEITLPNRKLAQGTDPGKLTLPEQIMNTLLTHPHSQKKARVEITVPKPHLRNTLRYATVTEVDAWMAAYITQTRYEIDVEPVITLDTQLETRPIYIAKSHLTMQPFSENACIIVPKGVGVDFHARELGKAQLLLYSRPQRKVEGGALKLPNKRASLVDARHRFSNQAYARAEEKVKDFRVGVNRALQAFTHKYSLDAIKEALAVRPHFPVSPNMPQSIEALATRGIDWSKIKKPHTLR